MADTFLYTYADSQFDILVQLVNDTYDFLQYASCETRSPQSQVSETPLTARHELSSPSIAEGSIIVHTEIIDIEICDLNDLVRRDSCGDNIV